LAGVAGVDELATDELAVVVVVAAGAAAGAEPSVAGDCEMVTVQVAA